MKYIRIILVAFMLLGSTAGLVSFYYLFTPNQHIVVRETGKHANRADLLDILIHFVVKNNATPTPNLPPQSGPVQGSGQ